MDAANEVRRRSHDRILDSSSDESDEEDVSKQKEVKRITAGLRPFDRIESGVNPTRAEKAERTTNTDFIKISQCEYFALGMFVIILVSLLVFACWAFENKEALVKREYAELEIAAGYLTREEQKQLLKFLQTKLSASSNSTGV